MKTPNRKELAKNLRKLVRSVVKDEKEFYSWLHDQIKPGAPWSRFVISVESDRAEQLAELLPVLTPAMKKKVTFFTTKRLRERL